MTRVLCAIVYATVLQLPSHRYIIPTYEDQKNICSEKNIPQPTCMTIFNELINWHEFFKYLRLGFFFVLPTLTYFQS